MMYKTDGQNIGNTLSPSLREEPPSREGGSSTRRDPEVRPKKKRQYYTASYKLRILNEVDNFTEQGQLGALLRREGLYYSAISRWRKQRNQGQLQGLSQNPGRKKTKNEQEQKRIKELEQENARLKNELKKAETVIEFQKKISEILDLHKNSDQEDEGSS